MAGPDQFNSPPPSDTCLTAGVWATCKSRKKDFHGTPFETEDLGSNGIVAIFLYVNKLKVRVQIVETKYAEINISGQIAIIDKEKLKC